LIQYSKHEMKNVRIYFLSFLDMWVFPGPAPRCELDYMPDPLGHSVSWQTPDHAPQHPFPSPPHLPQHAILLNGGGCLDLETAAVWPPASYCGSPPKKGAFCRGMTFNIPKAFQAMPLSKIPGLWFFCPSAVLDRTSPIPYQGWGDPVSLRANSVVTNGGVSSPRPPPPQNKGLRKRSPS